MHDEQDIWKMGNLSKKMPVTTWTFVIGALALSGIPPLSGFWSKDEILLGAFASGHIGLYIIGSFVAFLTAFYMFRLIFVAFFGNNTAGEHAHESPKVMTVPLVILAVISVLAGFVGSPLMNNAFGHYITYAGAVEHEASLSIMIVSALIAITGIVLAYFVYQKQAVDTDAIKEKCSGLYNLLYNKYYIDEFYALLIKYCVDGTAKVMEWFDLHVINGIVNGVANFTGRSGNALKYTENGQVQSYALYMFAGVMLILISALCAVFTALA
jgi:NADH-quinone oxidoreductase subunit L